MSKAGGHQQVDDGEITEAADLFLSNPTSSHAITFAKEVLKKYKPKVRGNTALVKVTHSNTSQFKMSSTPISWVPPSNGGGSPKRCPSMNAFCTSSEEVLTAFNFTKEDDETGGYEQMESHPDNGSPKVTLICGHLFRQVARKPRTLASILLEPQNKVLLEDFLQASAGNKTSSLGASLRHWATQRLLEEESKGSSAELPCVKTTQRITPNGDLNDPAGMDRLTQVVTSYLAKLEEEDPLNQAVSKLGSLVTYICDSDPEQDPISALIKEREGMNKESNIHHKKMYERYESIIQQLAEAEAELDQLKQSCPAPTPQAHSQVKLLHQIAGFDSLVENVASSDSQCDLGPMVFPTKSGMLSAGFPTASKLCTISDSKSDLEGKVSLTLLASSASRRAFQLNVDENGNPINTSETDIRDKGVPVVEEALCGETSHEKLVDDLEQAAIDTTSEENVNWSHSETGSIPPESHIEEPQNVSTQADQNVLGQQVIQVSQDEPLKDIPLSSSEPDEDEKEKTSRSNSAKGTKVKDTVKTSPGNDSTPVSSTKFQSTSKKTESSSRPKWTTGKMNNTQKQVTSASPKRANVPGPANPKLVHKPVAKSFKQSNQTASPAKTPILPRKVEISKVSSSGPKRLEFTKVKQTVSYRQLNKENLEILQTPGGRLKDLSDKREEQNGVVPPKTAGGMLERTKGEALSDSDTTLHRQSSDPTLNQQVTPNAMEVLPSASNSQTPSVTKMKSVLSVKSKPSIGYVELRRHKKSIQEAAMAKFKGTKPTGRGAHVAPLKAGAANAKPVPARFKF